VEILKSSPSREFFLEKNLKRESFGVFLVKIIEENERFIEEWRYFTENKIKNSQTLKLLNPKFLA